MDRRGFLKRFASTTAASAAVVITPGVIAPAQEVIIPTGRDRLVQLIVSDWRTIGGEVTLLSLKEQHTLIKSVAEEFLRLPPTDDGARNVAAFMRVLPFSPTMVNELWSMHGAQNSRQREAMLAEVGVGPIKLWNLIAGGGSIDHAISFHRHVAKHFVFLLKQTDFSNPRRKI